MRQPSIRKETCHLREFAFQTSQKEQHKTGYSTGGLEQDLFIEVGKGSWDDYVSQQRHGSERGKRAKHDDSYTTEYMLLVLLSLHLQRPREHIVRTFFHAFLNVVFLGNLHNSNESKKM
jgi:hypothetical protein